MNLKHQDPLAITFSSHLWMKAGRGLEQTSNMCVAITTVSEVVGAFGGRELVNELSDRFPEAGDGPLPR